MWIGLTVVLFFLALVIAVYSMNCISVPLNKEGFKINQPNKTIPAPRGLLEGEEAEVGREYTTVADLPRAPNGYLAADAPVAAADPVNKKVSAAMVNGLLNDMKAFRDFELEYIAKRSDPNIQTAVSTFRAQIQTVLEEADVVNKLPGVASTLTYTDYDAIYSNLRYLQKAYRNYENVGLVPGGVAGQGKKLTEAGAGVAGKEGFTASGAGERATLNDLRSLKKRLDAEIKRLSSSGTDDPVLRARVDLFTTLRGRIESIINDVSNGTITALDIPIMKSDINAFLPALSGSTSPSSGRVAGGESLAKAIQKWFMSGSASDGSGSLVNLVGRAEAEELAEKILKGITIDFRYKYMGENEVSKAWADATVAVANAKRITRQGGTGVGEDNDIGAEDPNYESGYGYGEGEGEGDSSCIEGFQAGRFCGGRGEFDSRIRELEKEFTGGRPSFKKREAAKLDWRDRAKGICENIRKAGLKPEDYGCMVGATQQVGPNFSWRGYAKMVCTRLDTNAVSGTAVTMGCPPVEWKGWRS